MTTVEPPLRPPRSDEPESLWRHRDFRTFWIGETVSLLGTQITNLALPLTAVYAFHATDAQVGLLRFLQLAPYIGLALVFGVWVDRHRRGRVMLWTNLARMVLVALVPVLNWLHGLDMAVLLVISCVVGVTSVMFDVSWMPFVPGLVRDPGLQVDANAKMGISSSTAGVAGPGIAGAVVAALTAPAAMALDALSYGVSVTSLLLIRTPEPRPAQTADRRVASEVRDGLHWVFGRPILSWLAMVGFCCNLSMTAVWTMFLLYGTHELQLSPSDLGLIFTISSIGGVIGASASGWIIKKFPLGRVYFTAQSGLLLGPALIVLISGPRLLAMALAAGSFFLTYLGLGVANVIIVTVRQAATPQALMSRMTACFRMLLFGGGAIGGLLAGLLTGWMGDRNALVAAAVFSAVVVLALAASPVSRMRTLPPNLEDRD
ncbi:MFS transporter [Actinospica robiniae]|uniref:MFS transporter n=1 Tax=Actinospica robiniae TaxID=304901 RepID=UPI00040D554E|nr:MFS transporter [Actinospica robiniae]